MGQHKPGLTTKHPSISAALTDKVPAEDFFFNPFISPGGTSNDAIPLLSIKSGGSPSSTVDEILSTRFNMDFSNLAKFLPVLALTSSKFSCLCGKERLGH